jgi:copper chaperone CopZ
MIHTYKVSGMSCGGCAHNVEGILSEIEGLVSANVDIATGIAQVEMKEHISMDIFNKAFQDTKYKIEEVSK